MTEKDRRQEHLDAIKTLRESDIRESSPEDPLIVPEAMSFPLGTHYFRIPDPRGLDVNWFRYQTSNPEIGRSVVVEMKVIEAAAPFCLRWAFRYLWADWSLVVEFGGDERWSLVIETGGPRTEMQVRALFELIDKLHFNQAVAPLKHRWFESRRRRARADRRARRGSTREIR